MRPRQVSQSELSDGLVALAGVTHIPIWVFYRSELETDGPLDELADLQGLRVSLDEPESSTRALARFLLGYSGIAEDSFEVVDASPRTAPNCCSTVRSMPCSWRLACCHRTYGTCCWRRAWRYSIFAWLRPMHV